MSTNCTLERLMIGKISSAAPILLDIMTSIAWENARKKYPVVSKRRPATTAIVENGGLGMTWLSPTNPSTAKPKPRRTKAAVSLSRDEL